MRKLLTLVLAISFALTLTPAHAGITTWRDTECRFQGLDGHAGWTQWEVKKTIWCATQRFSVDTSTALYIADRESNFEQYATNSTSGACSIYQHLPRYWSERLATLRRARPILEPFGLSCYNARSNVLVAIWMARNGWSAWS